MCVATVGTMLKYQVEVKDEKKIENATRCATAIVSSNNVHIQLCISHNKHTCCDFLNNLKSILGSSCLDIKQRAKLDRTKRKEKKKEISMYKLIEDTHIC